MKIYSQSEQDVKTFKIYTDLDLAIKKSELKIIDYYINLIENRNNKNIININMSNMRFRN